MLKCASSRENCFLNRSELRNFPNDQLAAFAYALIRSKNTSGQQKKRKKKYVSVQEHHSSENSFCAFTWVRHFGGIWLNATREKNLLIYLFFSPPFAFTHFIFLHQFKRLIIKDFSNVPVTLYLLKDFRISWPGMALTESKYMYTIESFKPFYRAFL